MKKKSTEVMVQGKPTEIDKDFIGSLSISPEQRMILDARFEGKSFWEIDENKHRFVSDEIILTMAAIYGCKMCETELMASYLSKEFILLLSGFGNEDLTLAEILLAMRFNAQFLISHKYTGLFDVVEPPPVVCVSFLSKVLHNYKVLRNGLNNLIERKIMGY